MLDSLNYKKIILWSAILLGSCIVVYSTFNYWKQGTRFGPPCYSPNHEYYVQHFQNYNWQSFFSLMMPGQAGDGQVGYTRLYDKNGNFLRERFGNLTEESMPYWLHNEVFLWVNTAKLGVYLNRLGFLAQLGKAKSGNVINLC